MTSGELLSIEPFELQFPFALGKQISCSLQLSNKSNEFVAFKVKTTNPKKYCVRPNTGVVLPRSTCDVIVTMQAQREMPPDMQCKDKFLLQSVVASPGAGVKDITPELFNKESGRLIEESKLRVLYVSPPRPPSPVREESEEGTSPRVSVSDGTSPRVSVSDNGNQNANEFTAASRAFVDRQGPEDSSAEARAMITKLTEEKESAYQQNKRLQQELELMRRESNKKRASIPFVVIVLIGLIGIIVGYLMKKA